VDVILSYGSTGTRLPCGLSGSLLLTLGSLYSNEIALKLLNSSVAKNTLVQYYGFLQIKTILSHNSQARSPRGNGYDTTLLHPASLFHLNHLLFFLICVFRKIKVKTLGGIIRKHIRGVRNLVFEQSGISPLKYRAVEIRVYMVFCSVLGLEPMRFILLCHM
jgi:hypothetical protein